MLFFGKRFDHLFTPFSGESDEPKLPHSDPGDRYHRPEGYHLSPYHSVAYILLHLSVTLLFSLGCGFSLAHCIDPVITLSIYFEVRRTSITHQLLREICPALLSVYQSHQRLFRERRDLPLPSTGRIS